MDNARIARLVVARIKEASPASHPNFDKLFQNHAMVSALLKKVLEQVSKIADAVETSLRKGKYTDAQGLAKKAMEAAYKAVDFFRPIYGSKGLSELEGSHDPSFNYTRAIDFHDSVTELYKVYDKLAGVLHNGEPEDTEKATHDLAMAVFHTQQFFKQFVEGYKDLLG